MNYRNPKHQPFLQKMVDLAISHEDKSLKSNVSIESWFRFKLGFTLASYNEDSTSCKNLKNLKIG